MPKYNVQLWEGKEQVVFQVDAPSPEEAQRKAEAYREQRFQQGTDRAALEEEQARLQEDLASRSGVRGAAKVAGAVAGQTASSVAAGMGDAVLGTAQALTDTAAWAGSETAARASEALQERRNDLSTANVEFGFKMMENVVGRRLTDAEKAKMAEEQESGQRLARMGTEALVGIAAGSVALRATSLPKMIGVGATEGGLGGYLMSAARGETLEERNAERLFNMKLGTALGAGTALIPGAIAGVKNWMVRAIRKAGGGKQQIAARRQMLEDAGIKDYSAGQVTGDPVLLQAEAQAAGKEADRMLRAQAEQARQGLANRIGLRVPPLEELTAGSRKIIKDGAYLVQKAIGKMKGERNRAFEKGIEQITALTNDAPIISTDGAIRTAREIIDSVQKQYGNVPYGRMFKDIANDLNEAAKAGGLTAKQANSLLLRLGSIKKAGEGIFDLTDASMKQSGDMYRGHAQRIAHELKEQIEAGFDQAADSLPGLAGQQLKRLRADYGAASARIDGMRDDYLASLNLKGASTKDIMARLGKADTEVVRDVMDAVSKLDGGVAWKNRLAQGLFEDAVDDGSRAALTFGGKAGDFNLKAFQESLMRRVEASKLKGIISPEQERNAVKSAEALKLLFNDPKVASPVGVIKTHLPFGLQEVAINVMSRDPGFTARLIAGGISKGGTADSLFFTKEGVDILTGAVKSMVVGARTGAATQAAIAILAGMFGDASARQAATELLQGEQQ